MKRMIAVVVTAVLAAVLCWSAASEAAVKGKSAIEAGTFLVSGGSDYALQLNYRATESYSFGAAIEPFSGSSAGFSFSGTATSVWARYYFAPQGAAEPYLVGEINSASVTVSGGGSGSASQFAFGVGTTYRINDQVQLRGGLAFTSGAVGYHAGLTYDYSAANYVGVGLSGSGGNSALYLGLGMRF